VGVVNVVIERKPGYFAEFQVFVGIVMDSVSLFMPYILFSIFTRWPDTTVQISATLPYLLMILLSGTYSPSAGLPVLKQLRYLFPRFYLFCMLPGITPDYMEDCPANDTWMTLYAVLSAMIGPLLFFLYIAIRAAILRATASTNKRLHFGQRLQRDDDELASLQIELYGEQAVHTTNDEDSSTAARTLSQNSSEDATNSCGGCIGADDAVLDADPGREQV
jgi:hypothetical protein